MPIPAAATASVRQLGDPGQGLETVGTWRPVTFGIDAERLIDVQIEDDRSVRVKAPGLRIRPPSVTRDGAVLYRNVATQTDLRYRVEPAGLVKELVLRDRQAPRSFTFVVADPARVLGQPEPTAEGGLVFSREVATGVALEIPAPVAYEPSAAGLPRSHDSGSASLAWQPVAGGYEVTVSVEPDWLEAHEFPVILDPSLVFDGDAGLSNDGWTHYDSATGSGDATIAKTSWLYAGRYTDTYDPLRSAVRFDLSAIPPDAVVETATLSLDMDDCIGTDCATHDYTTQLHAVTGPWDDATTYDQLSAITVATPFSSVIQPAFTAGLQTRHEFDVAAQVQSWVDGTDSDHGMVIRLADETTEGALRYQSSRHSSGPGPVLSVTYSEPPPAPDVTSPTHPDAQRWSADDTVRFQWDVDGTAGIAGYSYVLDRDPDTVPGDADDGTTAQSVTFHDVDEGQWWFHIRAQSDAGLWSPTTHAPFRIDTATPTLDPVSSSSHPDQVAWSQTDDAVLSWAGADTPNGSGLAGFSYSLDKEPTTVPNGTVDTTSTSRTFANLTPGGWWFHIRAVDVAGRLSDTRHYRLRIDDRGPARPVVLSSSHKPDTLSSDATVEVWWDTPTDRGAGTASFSWQFTNRALGGEDPLIGSSGVTSTPYGTYAISDTLEPGDWYFHVWAHDAAGNRGTKTTYGPLLIGVDDGIVPAAPEVTSSHRDQDAWYSAGTLRLQWDSLRIDSDSGGEGYSYVLDHDPTTEPDTIEDTDSSSISFEDLADDVWWFHIRRHDSVGVWSDTTHFRARIDTTAPGAPPLTAPTHPDPTRWSEDSRLVLLWDAPADVAPVVGHHLDIDAQPATVPTTPVDDTTELATLLDGVRWAHLRATDAAGNVGDTAHLKMAVTTGVIAVTSPVDEQTVWGDTAVVATGPPEATAAAFETRPPGGSWMAIDTASATDDDGAWRVTWSTGATDSQGSPLFPDGPYELRVTFELDSASSPPLPGPAVTVDNSLDSFGRVEADYRSGLITEDDRALNGTYAILTSENLPARYATDTQVTGDPDQLGFTFLRNWQQLSQATRDRLTDEFTPTTQQTLTTSSTATELCGTNEQHSILVVGRTYHCRKNSVDGSAVARWSLPSQRFTGTVTDTADNLTDNLEAGSNNVPDWIDRVLWSLDRAHDAYRSLGFQLPTDPTTIYFDELVVNDGAWVPPIPGAPEAIWMDTSTGDGIYLPMHEYFHVSQYTYFSIHDAGWESVVPPAPLGMPQELLVGDYRWLMEATAEWATRQAMLQVDGADAVPSTIRDLFNDSIEKYAEHIVDVYADPSSRMNDVGSVEPAGRAYGSFPLFFHLEDELDGDVDGDGIPDVDADGDGEIDVIVRDIWDIVGDGLRPNSIFHSLTNRIEHRGSSFADIVDSYWRANHRYPEAYGTSTFTDPSEFWGDELPGGRLAHGSATLVDAPKSGRASPLAGGSQLIELTPWKRPGLLRVRLTASDNSRLTSTSDITGRIDVTLDPVGSWPSGCAGAAPVQGTWVDDDMLVEIDLPQGCDRATLLVTNHARPDGGDKRVDVDWTAEFFAHHVLISHGDVRLGINAMGTLGAPTSTPSEHRKSNFLGDRYLPEGQTDGLSSPAGPCEGWGLYDHTSSLHSGVNRCFDLGPRGVDNLTLVDFNSSSNSATSTVDLTSSDGDVDLRVTHDYRPSSSASLFALTVTLDNRGNTPIQPLYRRVMDWDVEIPDYNGDEFMTIQATTIGYQPIEVVTSTKGTEDPDPGNPADPHNDSDHKHGYFENQAPFSSDADYGLLMDLRLGTLFDDTELNPGETFTFEVFVGAAASQVYAELALQSVGANVWVLAEPATDSFGKPATFILGYISQDEGPGI